MPEDSRTRPQVNNSRLWTWLALLVALCLGGAAGFLLRPAEMGSAAPWEMSLAYQERFVDVVSREYLANGDSDYLNWVLDGWEKEKITALLVDMEANADSLAKEQRLKALREALSIPSAEPSFWQLMRRQPTIMLLGLAAGVILLLAGVLGIFLATEEDRVRQVVEQAIFVQAQANAAVPAPLPLRAANENRESETSFSTTDVNPAERGRRARPAPPSEEAAGEYPAQSVNSGQQPTPQTAAQTQAQPGAAAPNTTPDPAAQPAQPSPAQQVGQQPQQPAQTAQAAAPKPEDAPQPLVDENELTTGGTSIGDLVADVFDDSDEQLHQQAVLKGLGPVDLDDLLKLLYQVKNDLRTGGLQATGLVAAENHRQETRIR